MKRTINCMLVLAMVCWGFASCGGDDDDSSPSSSDSGNITPTKPVREEIKPLLGYWSIEANDSYHYVTFPDYKIFFYQDGICKITDTNSKDSNVFGNKSWDYDESNKYLSIAGIAKAQWQITALSNEAWSGLALWTSGSNGYSAKRTWTSERDFANFIMRYDPKWVCDAVSLEFKYYKGSGYSSDSYSIVLPDADDLYISIGDLSRCEINEDKDKDILTINYIDKKNNGEIRESANIEIVHPYSYKDVYMNVTLQDNISVTPSGGTSHENKSFSGKFIPNR